MKAVERASHGAGKTSEPEQTDSIAIILTCLQYLEAEALKARSPDSAACIRQAIKGIISRRETSSSR